MEPPSTQSRSPNNAAALRSELGAKASALVKFRVQRNLRRAILFSVIVVGSIALVAGQTQRRRSTPPSGGAQQAPRGSASKYSAFLHSSAKHKSLECSQCHKIPTAWAAQRDFPDVADFPNHDACVRCHRQQFFTRQAFAGTGPAICTVCHLRPAPREAARFAFGKPNNANQSLKPKDERQFTIEFPHDKHQNVIALLTPQPDLAEPAQFQSASNAATTWHHIRASFSRPADDKKADYNNCTICHQRSERQVTASSRPADVSDQTNNFFKTTPHSHDSCFDCHWKNQKPISTDCGGCHKPTNTFVASPEVKRISAKFNHEGGKGEHVLECTTCHINITRAATLRGLTPDVPIAACTTCHKDNKKITYPKVVTIEEELAQYRKSNACSYCHTTEVGTKKPPASHEAAAQ